MPANLNNEQFCLNRIKNHVITRVVKSMSADDNLHGYVVVCSECDIEESDVPLRAMTAMSITESSTFYASPSLINADAPVSEKEREQLEFVLTESTVSLMKQLKDNSQLDLKKFEFVSDDEFVDMLSECC